MTHACNVPTAMAVAVSPAPRSTTGRKSPISPAPSLHDKGSTMFEVAPPAVCRVHACRCRLCVGASHSILAGSPRGAGANTYGACHCSLGSVEEQRRRGEGGEDVCCLDYEGRG